MKVAVIILNWNGRRLLEQFLPSVIENSPQAKVYVADNASTDDSVSFVESSYPQIKIIRNETNGGFAKGYNDAIKKVDEEILILLNSDVEVTNNWLPPLLSEFEKNPELAAAQPKILDFRRRDYFEYAGASGGFIDALGYPYCRGRIFETLEKDQGQYDDTLEIFWASGACMAVRHKDFIAAGGFDEDFFAHQEEIDLCWRFFNMSKKVKAVGSSTVYHLGGGTLNAAHPKKTYYNFRNSLFALVKNAPSKRLLPLIFIRLILDGVAGARMLLLLKPRHTLAIIKAHFSFYTYIGKMWRKRKEFSKNSDYYKINSVVWTYYVNKIRKFKTMKNIDLIEH